MSAKEFTRLEVLQKIEKKRLKQKEAAKILGISPRHLRRLLHAYRKGGKRSLISKRRGKPSNHQLEPKKKERIIDLLHLRYYDFGPTLAQEKLWEVHGIAVSIESVRKIMIEEGLWKPKKVRHKRVHPMRKRRACYGELVQIDGSIHAWFEDRGPACSLIVYIDDATGKLMELLFTPAETTFSYFIATFQYLAHHGRPVAFYSDKHSIFKINAKNALTETGMTQFGRAMKQLDIEVICANSPQAKGRVERANATLQDRLVKELRLQGISDIEAANAFIPTFIEDYNRRFAVAPRSTHNAHRPVNATEEELHQIFSHQETRILSKNLTIQYKKVLYQINTTRSAYAMRKANVLVCEDMQGKVIILYKGKALDYTIFHKQEHQATVVTSKELDTHLDKNKNTPKPAENHPWRNYGYHLNGKPIQEVKT